jgi:hypothetical protein
MDPTNGKDSKTEQANQLIRGICVIILLLSFCVAYLWGVFMTKPAIDSAAFIGVLTLALTWFFKSRDEQQRKSDFVPPVATTKTIETDPSGAKREVTMTAQPGAAAPAPEPPKGATP